MNNKKISLIIDSMLVGCTEEQKAKLAELYKSAYTNTTEFKELNSLLEEYDFYGSVGADLYNQGVSALKGGMTQAGKFTENISTIEYVISNSKKLEKETAEYISHAEHSNKNLYIISKQQSTELKTFLLALFNSVCYTVTTLYGIKYLKDAKIDINSNALDMLKNVINEMSMILQELKSSQKPYSWRIYRKNFIGANIIHYNGYVFEKINLNYEEASEKYKKVSPYIFEPKEPSETLCYGFGNLTNLKINDGMRVIGSNSIITKLADNSLDNLKLDYYELSINTLLSSIGLNNVFVVDPSELCELLNRYFMMNQVKERNTKQLCPYCGKHNCNHFNIPRNFGK